MSGGTKPQRGNKEKRQKKSSHTHTYGVNKDKWHTITCINGDGDTKPLFWEKKKHDK